MKKCTWEGCDRLARNEQIASNGEVWADLCNEHAEELDGILDQEPKAILKKWIKAQGGSKRAASRLMGTMGGGR